MRVRPREVALGAVLLLLAARLVFWVVVFGEQSLQMDFAAFWTAGKAVGEGLSPYENHVERDPALWDGIDTYRHSRFLYPPLVARLFQPLAVLPYHIAKYAWTGLSLGALIGTLWIAARLAAVPRDAWRWLVVGCIALAFHPSLTLLERGQIDTWTLLLLVAAVGWLARPGTSMAAGALLAVATLLKLHCVFLVPFLLLRRQWRALAGFAVGGAALLLLGVVVDGSAAIRNYVTDELPRITRYGERGTAEMRLPPPTAVPLGRMLANGETTMDGRRYRLEAFSFSLNASLVRTPLGHATWRAIRTVAPRFAPAQVSWVLLLPFLGLFLGWQRRYGPPEGQRAELVYWQAAMVVILLCAPVSWVMGTVWLLPVGVLLVSPGAWPRAKTATLLCSFGLLLAALPDPAVGWIPGSDQRFVVAELFTLAGLLAFWRQFGSSTAAAAPASISRKRPGGTAAENR